MGNSQNRQSLKGEASCRQYGFLDLDGNNTKGNQVIFPILKQTDAGAFRLLGTGFFIASFGLFISAKHVLRDCFDQSGMQRFPICILQIFPDNHYRYRNILWCSSHNTADVAVALAEPWEDDLLNPCLPLTTSPPPIGETVATYAYPQGQIKEENFLQILNIKDAFFDGQIVEFLPNGRDQSMLPGPCYQTSIVLHGGASGGPVVGKSGRVFGVNSTGFDDDKISYLSRINEILRLPLPHLRLPNEQVITSSCILDLSNAGWIDLR
jgi:hypothetical protein